MTKSTAWALSTLVVLAMTAGLGAQGTVIAIRGVTLIDGTGRAPVAGATVVIEGGRIRDVGTTITAPPGATIIDGAGKFLIPGLIDAHIHLRGGRGGNQPAADQEREGIRALHGYLYSGVTTVFDAGNRPEYIMGLRAKEQSGAIVSPRIFATGGTVASPNGHGGPYNVEAWPADRKLLDQHLATKPDLAKIGQDEHGWGTRPLINQLPDRSAREDHPLLPQQGRAHHHPHVERARDARSHLRGRRHDGASDHPGAGQ